MSETNQKLLISSGKSSFPLVLVSIAMVLPCAAAEFPSASMPLTRRLDLEKLQPESVSAVHSKEVEAIRISPFSYEVLFPDDTPYPRSSSSSRVPWITDPSQSPRNGSRVGSRGSYQSAQFSSSDGPLSVSGLPLVTSGASSEIVRTVSVGVGYLVETDSTYKYGLPVPSSAEYGQHIVLEGSPFKLGQVEFPYFSSIEQSHALVFRLYSVGTAGLPASLLYQSNPQDVHAGIYSVNITYDMPLVPKDLIFSVAFYGISKDASVGLLLPNADPVIGSTPGQILSKVGGTWTPQTVAGGIKGAISISVTPAVVPEPKTVLMVFLAGIILWTVRRKNA